MQKNDQLVIDFVWVLAISMCWLLPNHYYPWSSFHLEAWAAISIWFSCLIFFRKGEIAITVDKFTCVCVLLSLVPWIQYVFGQIGYFGQSWISSLYIIGFVAAYVSGRQWEKEFPNKIQEILFSALALASILSLGLQLYTILGLWTDSLGEWYSMGQAGSRPYANLGQANQLSTLMLLGVVSALWLFEHKKINLLLLQLMIALMAVGVALTQSRTGFLIALLLVFSVCRAIRDELNIGHVVMLIGCYVLYLLAFFFCRYLPLFEISSNDGVGMLSGRADFNSDLRLVIWEMSLNWLRDHALFGMGLQDISKIQVDLIDQYPNLNESFSKSHNLILDVLLWFGVPIGLFVLGSFLHWWHRVFLVQKNKRLKFVIMALMVLVVHSLFEFPLHYSYFLLPFGVLMGCVAHFAVPGKIIRMRGFHCALLGLALLLILLITLIDYLKIEYQFNLARISNARIVLVEKDLVQNESGHVLTQLVGLVGLVGIKVDSNISKNEINILKKAAMHYPSGDNFFKTAYALHLSGDVDTAQQWFLISCKLVQIEKCKLYDELWRNK